MKRWEYLISEQYKIRKIIASHYLSSCDNVIDVGSYGEHLIGIDANKLHSIDPLMSIPDSFHGTFSEWLSRNQNLYGTIGVAILGFDIEGDGEYEELLSFLIGVDTIVLEYAMEFEPSVQQSKHLMSQIPHKVETVINLELPEVKTEGFPTYSKRKITILKRG